MHEPWLLTFFFSHFCIVAFQDHISHFLSSHFINFISLSHHIYKIQRKYYKFPSITFLLQLHISQLFEIFHNHKRFLEKHLKDNKIGNYFFEKIDQKLDKGEMYTKKLQITKYTIIRFDK